VRGAWGPAPRPLSRCQALAALEVPPEGAKSAAWNLSLWVTRKYTRQIRPLPIHSGSTLASPPGETYRTVYTDGVGWSRGLVLCPWSFVICRAPAVPEPARLASLAGSKCRGLLPLGRFRFPNPESCRPRATSDEPRAANPGRRLPVPRSRFPAVVRPAACPPLAGPSATFFVDFLPIGTAVIHNGSCQLSHVKFRQIRVKIDQKGDVFRQKAIKKARISSCPS